MANESTQGALRGARTTGTNVGVRNTRENRTPTNNKDFYDDLGFSTTPDEATAYRANEAEYQAELTENKNSLTEAQESYDTAKGEYDTQAGALATAQGQLPSLNEAVNQSWSEYKSGLMAIRVVGKGDTIQGTYYLPASVFAGFEGQEGVFSSQINSNTANVMTKGWHNTQLRDALGSAATDLETNYKANASSQIGSDLASAYSEIQGATSTLGEAQGQLSTFKNDIDAASSSITLSEEGRAAQWKGLQDDYTAKVANMDQILGGMTVG